MAEYIEGEGARKQKAAEAAQEKLEKLERKIARAEGDDGERSGEGSKKRRLEDTEYVEQSKEIVENVKSAVLAGEFFPYRPLFIMLNVGNHRSFEEKEETKVGDRPNKSRGIDAESCSDHSGGTSDGYNCHHCRCCSRCGRHLTLGSLLAQFPAVLEIFSHDHLKPLE